MPSFQSAAINFLLRNRHLFQGRKRKETFTMESSIQDFRDICERGAARYAKIPEGITITEEIIDDIKSEWIIPDGSDPEMVVMYVHGGGYVSGSCNDHRGFVSKFAKKAGFRFLVYEYRLAPEFTYPAALEDSVKVYSALLQRYSPSNILIAGESAGGGLCLATLLALKDRKIPLPVAGVAISPWTDLTCSRESYRTKNKRSLAPLDSWYVFSRHYYGTHDPADPFISPLFGDLGNLPPLFINAGTDDELFDDGKEFAAKAARAGTEVIFREGIGMVHCYPLLAPMFPEATKAMEEITDFVKKRLGKK